MTAVGRGAGGEPGGRDAELARRERQVRAEVARRGLASFMNRTRWEALRAAVVAELPFPPPFREKSILGPPAPPLDPAGVWHHGDWSALEPLFEIEWIEVLPRHARPTGRLTPPAIVDATAAFRDLLVRLHIPFREDAAGAFRIYGYASADPATLVEDVD